MGSQILTTSQAVIDMSKLLATLSNNNRAIHMASQAVMEDNSNTDKVSIHSMLARSHVEAGLLHSVITH